MGYEQWKDVGNATEGEAAKMLTALKEKFGDD